MSGSNNLGPRSRGQKVGFQDAVEVVESANEAVNEFVENVTHLDETLNPYDSWFNQRE